MAKKLSFVFIGLFFSCIVLATQVVPIDKQVVVQVVDKKSSGGIIIPDVDGKVKTGIVVTKGDNATNVNSGDLVLFGKYSGTEVKIGGEELLILRETDILGILN